MRQAGKKRSVHCLKKLVNKFPDFQWPDRGRGNLKVNSSKQKDEKKKPTAPVLFPFSIAYNSLISRLYFYETWHTSLQSALFRALFLPYPLTSVFYDTLRTYVSLEVFQKYLSILVFAESFEKRYYRVPSKLNRQKRKKTWSQNYRKPLLLHYIFLHFF